MDPAFDADRAAVLAQAHARRRRRDDARRLRPGHQPRGGRAGARACPGRAPASASTPISAAEASDADFAALAELARRPEVVAIGETGLDNYRQFTPPARQREALAWHLAPGRASGPAAHRPQSPGRRRRRLDAVAGRGTPRRAQASCTASARPTRPIWTVCSTRASRVVRGTVTFKNAASRISASMAARVPLDRLLVETDCPYLAPEPHRGRRNEPAFVRDTASVWRRVRRLPFEPTRRAAVGQHLRRVPGGSASCRRWRDSVSDVSPHPGRDPRHSGAGAARSVADRGLAGRSSPTTTTPSWRRCSRRCCPAPASGCGRRCRC